MATLLLLTGGLDHAHDFTALAEALGSIIGEEHEVFEIWEPDEAIERLSDPRSRPDAVVVNALRWRMLGDRFEPWRDQWAFTTSDEFRQTLTDFIAAGGGLFANHTASICFDDWDEWGNIVGGRWNWDRSWHPPPGPVEVELVGKHPVIAGLGGRLNVVDEVYGDLDLQAGIEVLGFARRNEEDQLQPVIWAHQFGRGRVLYDGFGHDAASLLGTGHRDLIRQGLRWVTKEI